MRGFRVIRPDHELLGLHYSSAWPRPIGEIMGTAIRQVRMVQRAVPVSYEWEQGGLWHVRAAVLVPKGARIEVYLRHIGSYLDLPTEG